MYTVRQSELIERITGNFEKLIHDKTGVLPIDTLDSYKRDISLLCSEDTFTPSVMNFAMDIMDKIATAREKQDNVSLALLQTHTYECFRIRFESKDLNDSPKVV